MKSFHGFLLCAALLATLSCAADKRLPSGSAPAPEKTATGSTPQKSTAASAAKGTPTESFNPAVGDAEIKSSEVAYNLATEYAKQGDWSAADHYIDLAIRMQPDSKYTFAKGLFCLAQHRYDQAEMLLERSLAQRPGTTENRLAVLNALGAACMQLGKDEKALEQFRQVVNTPGMVSRYESYYNMGVIYVRQQKWLDADAVFQKVVEENPGYYRAWNKLCLVETQRGNWKQAVVYAKQAVDLVTRNYAALQSEGSEVFYNYGEALFQLKQYDESRQALMNALKIAPETEAGRKAKERLGSFGAP